MRTQIDTATTDSGTTNPGANPGTTNPSANPVTTTTRMDRLQHGR